MIITYDRDLKTTISNVDAVRSWVEQQGAYRVYLPEVYDNGKVYIDFGFDRKNDCSWSVSAHDDLICGIYGFGDCFVMGMEIVDDVLFAAFIKVDDPTQKMYKIALNNDDFKSESIAQYCINGITKGNVCNGFPDAEIVK